MKILVTGAAGFIGSHLCEQLVARGHYVIGIDSYSDYYDLHLKEINTQDLLKVGVNIIRFNLLDNLEEALPNDIDIIYHLAAQPGISDTTPFTNYLSNNIVATQNLLDWAMTANRKTQLFINIATSSIYGLYATSTEEQVTKPISHYGVTKLAAEQLVLAAQRSSKIPACSIRLFSVYGPRERPEKLYTKLIKATFEKKPFYLFAGSEEHERSFTYVKDITEGLVKILEHINRCDGEIINLGNSKVYTTGEGIALIDKITGIKAQIETAKQRLGDQTKTAANITKAIALLDYHPQTSFEDGLKAQVNWYKEKFL